MLISGGLFTGTVLSITWDRLPAWRHMEFQLFRNDFKHTVNIADRLQPILLVITIIGAIIFFFNTAGVARILVLISAIGFLITLILSVTILVPLQNRIVKTTKHSEEFIEMRNKWLQGHTGRTVLSLISFVLIALAASFH